MQMYGTTNNNDISINTYYNASDTCSISWNVIKDSIPSQWEFSFCFPNCYAIGIINAQNVIYPNEQVYLNCHIYPNGQEGNGIIQIEITTNNLYKDTVTWLGFVSSISSNYNANLIDFDNKQPFKIIDIFGRTAKDTKNKPLFYIFDDGTVEKRIVVELK